MQDSGIIISVNNDPDGRTMQFQSRRAEGHERLSIVVYRRRLKKGVQPIGIHYRLLFI